MLFKPQKVASVGKQRNNVDYIQTEKFTEYENILADKFGDRFKRYRKDYNKSLNYDTNGYIPPFPITITIEPINRCNLSCKLCYKNNHKAPKVGLSNDNFQSILFECQKHSLSAMVFGLGSEPLLDMYIRKKILMAKQAGVMDIFLGTNGVLLDESMAQFLIANEIARVEISVDAANPETYYKIRGVNHFRKIEANIERLVNLKRLSKAKLPVIRLCFLEQKDNFHERELFLNRWRGIVDYIDFQKVADFDHLDKLLKDNIPDLPEVSVEKFKNVHCAYPFNSLHIWSNGNVTPCCSFYGKNLILDNINKATLKDIWNGMEIYKIRKELTTGYLNTTCKVCLSQRDGTTLIADKS